jgi:Rha family phage regulatory protein
LKVANDLVVFVKDEEVRTDSLKVAEKFGREHRTILRAVDNLECSEDFRLHNYVQTSRPDSQGKGQRLVEMTFDGFVFLVMGFTGSEAAKVKEWYIGQFNAMRKQLQERATALPVSTAGMTSAQLLFLGNALTAQALATEKLAEQEAKIAELLPAAESYERLFEPSKGSLLPRDAANVVGITQNKFVAWLIRLKWLYRGKNGLRAVSSAWKLGYVETVYSEYKFEGETRYSPQVYVTAKGVAVLSRKRTDGEYAGGSTLKAALHRARNWLGVRG